MEGNIPPGFIGYAIADIATNVIRSIMSWGSRTIDVDYPLATDEYLIPISRDIYEKTEQAILQRKTVKIVDPKAETWDLFCEECVQIIDGPDYVDPDKLMMAAAIADLYEQLEALKGGTV